MPSRLEHYEAKYRLLAAELSRLGFVSQGSVVVRETSCGKQGCRCQADPPRRHGPYYQWSRAVKGKTVSRRLTENEAELYRSWIDNRRRLEAIVAEMEKVSAAAGEILLRQAATSERSHAAKR
jgi:hypothetical protein